MTWSFADKRIRASMRRWLAEPHQLVITLVAFCLLLAGTVLAVHRMMLPPDFDTEALHQARSGVIVMKTDDPHVCRQLTFHNETGTFGAPVRTSCSEPSGSAGQTQKPRPEGQFDAIRERFRGH